MTSAVPQGFPSLPPPSGGEAIEPPAALGEIFSRTFSAVKKRFWTLLGINLVGAVASTLSMVVVSGITAFLLQALERESLDQQEEWTLILEPSLRMVSLELFASQIVAAKVVFVVVAGADRLLAGERPTFSEMWRGSSGSLRRSIPLWLLAIPAMVALASLFNAYEIADALLSDDYVLLILAVGALSVVGMFIFAFLFPFLMIYFSVRWFYVGQLLTLEKASWAESLRRSWRLTSGEFWRTFGYLLVVYLWVMAVMSLFGAVPGLMPDDQVGAESGAHGGALEFFVVAPTEMLKQGALLLVLAISSVFLVVLITAMYRDQQYRVSLRERGIDPKNVTPVWQGPLPRQNPAEQPSPPPHPPSGHAPGAS